MRLKKSEKKMTKTREVRRKGENKVPKRYRERSPKKTQERSPKENPRKRSEGQQRKKPERNREQGSAQYDKDPRPHQASQKPPQKPGTLDYCAPQLHAHPPPSLTTRLHPSFTRPLPLFGPSRTDPNTSPISPSLRLRRPLPIIRFSRAC
ncbi:hypothetical protein BDV98DRAFT_568418 [Pterulicium gracile]|uniref:Uncharacterized protein n=1 Tax=Pterulicium gracile TaxID=1884261 RepID=A0A5C3QG63_9AGAR|nr:hypothetical protein BDV98DRAFT_568418 [Pterula gracilis]